MIDESLRRTVEDRTHKAAIRSPDARNLRHCLRDVAALTALPAVWQGKDRRHIAESLVEVLAKVLSVEFVYVRIRESPARDNESAEVASCKHKPDSPATARLLGKALAPRLDAPKLESCVLTIPHPLAQGRLQAAICPVGYGCDFGVLEAARHIKEQPWGKDIVLIALTGWGQDEDKHRAFEAGFNHHLTKPVDPAELGNLLPLIASTPLAHTD